jgi:hypothetical protein
VQDCVEYPAQSCTTSDHLAAQAVRNKRGWACRRLLAVLALCAVLVGTSGAVSVAAGLTITARRAVLTGEGASVTLTGTYTCGPFPGGIPDRGVIDFTFSVDLPSVSELRFRHGVALWSASGYVEGDGGLQTVSVPPTAIRIR